MKVVKVGQKLNKSIVLCLGYFGCLHLGHLKLIDRAKELAKNLDASVALFTFRNSSNFTIESVKNSAKNAIDCSVINCKKMDSTCIDGGLGKDNSFCHDKEIFTFDERMSVYEQAGIDVVVYADFTQDFSLMSGEDFLKSLTNSFDIKAVVCGEDYTFGSDRKSCDFIKNFFDCVYVEPIFEKENIKVSTAEIKNLVLNNKIEQANKLLSCPYFLAGNVVHGRAVGKTLGFPTANVDCDSNKLLPCGVFAGKCEFCFEGNKCTKKCLINVGDKPTFDIEKETIEVFINDFDGNLYGKDIVVVFEKFIRPIIKFSNVDDLICQIKKDLRCIDD